MPGLSPALFYPGKTLFNTLNKSVHRRANRFSGMVSAHCRNGLRLFAKGNSINSPHSNSLPPQNAAGN